MPKVLISDAPFMMFSEDEDVPESPAVEVRLVFPGSKRRSKVKRALIDTGADITFVYPSRTPIYNGEVHVDTRRKTITVGVEIANHIHYVECGYCEHDYAGTEDVLIGMNLVREWLLSIDGPQQRVSIWHA